jgi:predicted GNAT superfamily acetyltransferase
MGVHPMYDVQHRADGLPRPPEHMPQLEDQLVAAQIPADFMGIKEADLGLARDWRFFSRELFETAFAAGYIVTDFAFERDEENERGIYILTDGESTLESGR